jgi:D-alanine-D-alanine ligase
MMKKQIKSIEKDIIFRTIPVKKDCEAIFTILQRTGFFSDEELKTAIELIEEKLSIGEKSSYQFMFAERNGKSIGYSCYGLIPLTESSYDLYWIAVDPESQGGGLGRILLAKSEESIKMAGGLRVFAETSSRKQYIPTRKFYKSSGYKKTAYFPDFYSIDDGKVVFVKKV